MTDALVTGDLELIQRTITKLGSQVEWDRGRQPAIDDALAAFARVSATIQAATDALGWMPETHALIRELTEDLKRSYLPEKGWPPHIEAAGNLLEDLASVESALRSALAANKERA